MGANTVTGLLFLQPLKVMDPDHPLAALVRKAQQERNGTAAVVTKPEEVTDPAEPSTPAQYSSDREFVFHYLILLDHKMNLNICTNFITDHQILA